MSLMSKPKCWRKPGCLTTYCWHIREFLIESCVVSAALLMLGSWGTQFKWRLHVWSENFGILSHSGISEMGSRKEKLWAPWLQCEVAHCYLLGRDTQKVQRFVLLCVGSHWWLRGLLKFLRVRKQAEDPRELGAINCSVSFRGKKNQTVFFSTFFFLPQCS